MRALVAAALVCASALALSSCGPRMKRQVSLRPYKREVPPMPDNTVPRSGFVPVPSSAEAVKLRCPVPPTREALALGQRYYGYYCAHCHAPDGRGEVPVGQSYQPRPTDLTSARVQRMTEGELYRAMLVGVGHEPALAPTVAPDRRWPIVLYVRSLRP
jgi:hypothetical protein